MQNRSIALRVLNRVKREYQNISRRAIVKQRKVSAPPRMDIFGNQYGGYRIATGDLRKLPTGDNLIVYSFGIGEDLSFTDSLLDRLPVEIYAFDPTPRSISYVQNSETVKNDHFHFYPYGLSDIDGKQTFYMPKNEAYVSCSTSKQDWVGNTTIEVEMRTFHTILQMTGHTVIDILKMDIEGSEFDVMDEILASGVDIRQICLEVHDYLYSDGTGKKKLAHLINTLNEHGYCVAWVSRHVNEMTLLKANK